MDEEPILKSGYLLAWKPAGPVGYAVTTWTRNKYSHVGLLWKFRKRFFVLEAIWNSGVRIRSLSEDLPVDVIPTNIKWTKKVEEVALEKLGKRYNYFDALKVGFNLTPNEYNTEICSHYVAHIYHYAKMPIPNNVPMKPDDVVRICMEQNGNRVFTLSTAPKERKSLYDWFG